MEVVNQPHQAQFNLMLQEHSSQNILEQSSKKTVEELKKQRENLRRQTFFSPLQFPASNVYHNGNINNQYSEHLSVFDTLATAKFSTVKDIFINEVNKFIKVTKCFARNKYTKKLENLIIRIRDEKEPEDQSKLIDHLRCCALSLHDLTLVLNNLEYQLQQNTTSTKNIFSKDTIACYLEDCIVDLDKCWAGISSRFIHQYNTLSSLNSGISGRINIIKKELLDILLVEYLNAKKQENPDLFLDGNEIHIRNALNNAMQEILGIDKIKDPLEDISFDATIKQEFIELAIIEISPARITSMLADGLYQELTMILDKYHMSSWITEFKSDSDIFSALYCELDDKFFNNINILFGITEEANKLGIYSILDTIELETEIEKIQCLYRSREKLHQWIAKNLMPYPDAERLLIKGDDNNLAIWSTDDVFFKASETNNNSASENHITLQLPHIQDIDFIDFTDVEVGNKCYLSSHEEKVTTSIALVTQAMEQTDDAATIVKFICNNITKLAELPLLKYKVKNLLTSKLTNASFKQQFSDTIVKLIENKYDFNLDEIYYLLNNSACNDYLLAMIKQQEYKESIDYLLENIEIKYLDNITIELINKISAETKTTLFNMAINANSCNLVYNLLCDAGINAYNNITSNEDIFKLATKYNHIELAELLLQDKNLNIQDYHLYYSYYYLRSEITALYNREYILANKASFTNDTIIKHLQAKNQNGCPGLYISLYKGDKKTVTEYIDTIFNIDIDGITVEQKLKLIEAKGENGYLGLSASSHNGHTETVKEYIQAILKTNQFTNEQKLKLIEAKDIDGYTGLLLASVKGHDKVVKEYISLVLASDKFTTEQKLKLLEAKDINGYTGLLAASIKGHDKVVKEYISLVLASDKFTTEQKLKLLEEKDINGYTGLLAASMKGHDKVVKEYISLVLASDKFTTEQKLKLIEAKDIKGYTGLFAASMKGHDKVVKEYISLVLASDKFTTEQKLKLIEAKDIDGYTGLLVASTKGHDKVVKEYISLVLASDKFTTEQKLKLIEAKDIDGHTGLLVASMKDHDKVVKEYISLVLASDKFTTEQKLKLIEAKDIDGYTGLLVASVKGHDKVVKEYISLVLASDKFTTEQKLKLIEAKDINGYTGLIAASINGHDKVVKEYFKGIVASKEFTIKQKAMLFAEVSKQNLALFTELVNNSHLTVEEKNYFLNINSNKCTIL